MFTKIVVGTDGSDTAEVAVTLALELAGQSGATLIAVNAYRIRGGTGPSGTAPPATDESLTSVATKEIAAEILNSVKARAGAVTIETRSVQGSPADAVLGVAQELGADLIVVGNKGIGGARGRLLGSVPSSIARDAPCHVLIAKTT